MLIGVAGCLFASVAVVALFLVEQRVGLHTTVTASEALQYLALRKRWDAIGPNRDFYEAHCSSVGEPRPMRKVQDERVREIGGGSSGRDVRLPEAA